jgi:hypothetical protein
MSLNPKKSYDFITRKILKELPIIAVKYLTQLFNAVLLKGYWLLDNGSYHICCPERSNMKYIKMPSLIYQNMISLIVDFPTWKRPSIFMDVAMWEHHTLDSEAFKCSKIY